MTSSTSPRQLPDPITRIAQGQGTQADARALFDALTLSTRAAVDAYLRAAKGKLGALDPSLRGYQAWDKDQPRGAVIHVPAIWGRLALHSLDTTRRFMIRHKAGTTPVSTNIVIGWPDGEILVPVHPEHPSWHAGKVNRTHVGIDVVSPGPLVPRGEGATRTWHRWDGREAAITRPDGSPLQSEDILDFGDKDKAQLPWRHRWWHQITPQQVMVLAIALRALRLLYPCMDPAAVIRHSDIAAKTDPGPCVPLEAVRMWAWSTEDLDALWAEVAAGDGLGWPAFLLAQWARPTGLITAIDRQCPGRPGMGV